MSEQKEREYLQQRIDKGFMDICNKKIDKG